MCISLQISFHFSIKVEEALDKAGGTEAPSTEYDPTPLPTCPRPCIALVPCYANAKTYVVVVVLIDQELMIEKVSQIPIILPKKKLCG